MSWVKRNYSVIETNTW